MNIAALTWQQSYQISPIILTGAGLVSNVPGGMIPIISFTQPAAFSNGLLAPGAMIDTDNAIQFKHLSGDTLISQDFGEYPFANQAVAANAVIEEPLECTLMMVAPVNTVGGYAQKLALMTSIAKALVQHNQTGGTYSVLTPSYLYTNCLMKIVQDVTQSDTQPQSQWAFRFRQPLLTQQAAQMAQNSLISKISAGTQVNGQPAWSGSGPAVGNTASGQAPGTVPAATPLGGASTASPTAAGLPVGP